MSDVQPPAPLRLPPTAQVKPSRAPDKRATAPVTSASNVLETPIKEWIPIPPKKIPAAAPAHGKAGKAGKTGGDQTAKNNVKNSGCFEKTSSKNFCSESDYSTKNADSKNGFGSKHIDNLRASMKTSAVKGTPTRDVETGALVWCSPPGGNGAAVVVYEDGLTVTRHADGTVQRWQRGTRDGGGEVHSGIGLVLVECAGFPSVEVRVRV